MDEYNDKIILSRKAKIILVVIFLISCLPIAGLFALFSSAIFDQHNDAMVLIEKDTTIVVEGTIVDFDTREPTHGTQHEKERQRTYAAIYSYEIDGVEYTLTNDFYTSDLPEIGKKVTIYHDKETGKAISSESWMLIGINKK